MKSPFLISALIALTLGLVLPAYAQKAQSADYVVAVVNSEPITNAEVRAAMVRVVTQLKAQGVAVPPDEELRKGVVERLISDRAQLQMANETGIRLDDGAVELAEQNLARQNKLDVDAFRQRMAKEGISAETLRAQLRDQLLLQRLREREVESRVRVTDQEVDRAIADELAANSDPYAQEVNLAQLLVAVPERADEALVSQLQAQAQALLVRLRAGEDFDALVKQYSDGDRKQGGQFGVRRADRYPTAFIEATKSVPVGAVADLVRSGAGFHILKVVERRTPSTLVKTIAQTRVRHILIRTTPEVSAGAAATRLGEIRQRIVSGKTDFETAARDSSQDGSATQGGDLGWVTPGAFVPEFEDAMNRLKENEVSAPVLSRFGVHLIQVAGRRRVELNQRDVRELIRNQLRETKLEEAFASWSRDVRERAYVEMREAPQ